MSPNQIKIAYREWGEGPPVLFFHGYGGSVQHWYDYANSLSHDHKVIVPNLSHLFSAKDPVSFSEQISILKIFTEKFAAEFGIINIIGISYGATLAWGLASQYPEMVDRLILVNPMPPHPLRFFKSNLLKTIFFTHAPVSFIFLFLQSGFGKNLLLQMADIFQSDRFLPHSNHTEIKFQNRKSRKMYFIANLLGRFRWIIMNESWELWLERWIIPDDNCLLIYDAEDPLFLENTYDKLIQILEFKHTLRLHKAGHMAIHTAQNEIMSAFKNFLSVSYKDQFKKIG